MTIAERIGAAGTPVPGQGSGPGPGQDAVPGQGGADLAGAVAARLCHDLVSPLGAIGNGLELLEMSGDATGPELALIADSVAAARARLRLFRLGFGMAGGADQRIAVADLGEVAAAMGRLAVVVQADGDLARADAKMLLLALMCLETGLPWGGRVLVCRAETGGVAGAATGWRLVAEAARTRPDAGLWGWLTPGPASDHPSDAPFVARSDAPSNSRSDAPADAPSDVMSGAPTSAATGAPARVLPAPGEIHFALLAEEARRQHRRLHWEMDDTGAEIAF